MSAQIDTSDEHIAPLLAAAHPALRNVLRRYRIPPADAEDLVQDVVLEALLHWSSIRLPEAWLVGALRWKCVHYWRRARASLVDPVAADALEQVAEPDPPEQEQRGLQHDLSRWLATLPDHQQAILWLRYGLGYSVLEVATALGYTPANVKKIAGRTLARLRRDGARLAPADRPTEAADEAPEAREEDDADRPSARLTPAAIPPPHSVLE